MSGSFPPFPLKKIRAGDFNTKPGDTSYNVITKGQIQDDTDPADIPNIPYGSKWVAKLDRPLRSAYMISHGSEPDFTNFAQTSLSEGTFIDCLDYIFVSDEWKVHCGELKLTIVSTRLFPLSLLMELHSLRRGSFGSPCVASRKLANVSNNSLFPFLGGNAGSRCSRVAQ